MIDALRQSEDDAFAQDKILLLVHTKKQLLRQMVRAAENKILDEEAEEDPELLEYDLLTTDEVIDDFEEEAVLCPGCDDFSCIKDSQNKRCLPNKRNFDRWAKNHGLFLGDRIENFREDIEENQQQYKEMDKNVFIRRAKNAGAACPNCGHPGTKMTVKHENKKNRYNAYWCRKYISPTINAMKRKYTPKGTPKNSSNNNNNNNNEDSAINEKQKASSKQRDVAPPYDAEIAATKITVPLLLSFTGKSEAQCRKYCEKIQRNTRYDLKTLRGFAEFDARVAKEEWIETIDVDEDILVKLRQNLDQKMAAAKRQAVSEAKSSNSNKKQSSILEDFIHERKVRFGKAKPKGWSSCKSWSPKWRM